MDKKKVGLLLVLCFVFFQLFSKVVSAEGSDESGFDIMYLAPVFLGFLVALLMWKWFIPVQLANLQVAFEIDDDLYEVHRVTRDNEDARDLLSEGSVGYGLGLYMMGMTGVLILIGEFLFDPDYFYTPTLYLIGVLVGIPILISPWETMNAQLSKNRSQVNKSAIIDFFRRTLTLFIIVGITFASILYGAARI